MFTPGYCPKLDPDRGVWSLSKRHITNFTTHDSDELTHTAKGELLWLQMSMSLLESCLMQSDLKWKWLLN